MWSNIFASACNVILICTSVESMFTFDVFYFARFLLPKGRWPRCNERLFHFVVELPAGVWEQALTAVNPAGQWWSVQCLWRCLMKTFVAIVKGRRLINKHFLKLCTLYHFLAGLVPKRMTLDVTQVMLSEADKCHGPAVLADKHRKINNTCCTTMKSLIH